MRLLILVGIAVIFGLGWWWVRQQ